MVQEIQDPQKFKYIDLFSGCGGFSLGLESHGGELILAVEKSPMAAETFMRNLVEPEISDEDWKDFLEQPSEIQAQRHLIVGDVVDALKNPRIADQLSRTELDLVVGGPPCQGFSLAGRRNPADARNTLPDEFLKYVSKANPRFVVIENVLGMNLKFSTQNTASNSAFNDVALALETTGAGYDVQKLQLNAMHFGAAQSRERLFIVGCRKDISDYLGVQPSTTVWKSSFVDQISNLKSIPTLAPMPTCKSTDAVSLGAALQDFLQPGATNAYLRTLQDEAYWALKTRDRLMNTGVRRHTARVQEKFETYLALERLGLSPLLLKDMVDASNREKRNRLIQEISEGIFPIFDSKGRVLAASKADFVSLLEKYKTKKHSQRVLREKHVPPTVITSPDDYIHPLEPRVLSVRELARFQGFSDHFVFYSKETTGGLKRRHEVPQYSQVGNAVSPFVSRAFGILISGLVEKVSLSSI